ncbi:MAG: endonuclease/exonuclease/phosphatase family protein [Bacteroidia bacterium]|nr:endonuclease/exonuclease/phosphatase family protein [Bacteroidia bacterium]
MPERTFRIGTFNLFNLVLPERTYYGNRRYSQGEYAQKIEWIAGQIDKMRPDIIGFQEVFHPEALEDALNKSTYLRNAAYTVAAPDGELPRVGFATRFEILSREVIEAIPLSLDIEGVGIPIHTFSRPVLKVKVRVNPQLTMTVFVVHLKSKRPVLAEGESRENPVDLAKGQARALIRRAMEAAGLRHLLMESLQERTEPVVLIGDVNDAGLAVTSRIISGEPPHRRYPQEVKRAIWDVLLYHVKDIQARRGYHDFYFTHIHNAHHEALDHIMVSQELVSDNPENVGRIGLVSLFNDHLIDETLSDDPVKDWQSDHGQVVATVELRD